MKGKENIITFFLIHEVQNVVIFYLQISQSLGVISWLILENNSLTSSRDGQDLSELSFDVSNGFGGISMQEDSLLLSLNSDVHRSLTPTTTVKNNVG